MFEDEARALQSVTRSGHGSEHDGSCHKDYVTNSDRSWGCAGFHEVFTTDEHLVIVMEHASGGQLDACIEASGRFAESKARGLFLQIVDAVAFCHK